MARGTNLRPRDFRTYFCSHGFHIPSLLCAQHFNWRAVLKQIFLEIFMNWKSFTGMCNCLALVLKDEWASVGRTHHRPLPALLTPTWAAAEIKKQSDQMHRNGSGHSSSLLSSLPLPSSFLQTAAQENSVVHRWKAAWKKVAFPLIKQTQEWLFVDQMFQSSSLGRGFLTPGQQCSQHAGARLQ